VTEDQAIGMYLGLAVGDMLGAPHEFKMEHIPKNEIFPQVGGPHSVEVGEWTDDMAMARCIADVYKTQGRLSPRHLMKNFTDWLNTGKFGTRNHCFDCGVQTQRAIRDYGPLKLIDVDDRVLHEGQGLGNGAIMRMAPVVIFQRNYLHECIADAVRQTQITHPAAETIELSARFAHELFIGEPLIEYELDNPPPNHGRALTTLASAWYSVLTTDNFHDAVVDAVSRGDDADTVGAVAGQIAGRLYGASAIPSEWVDVLMGWNDINDDLGWLVIKR